MPEEEDFPTEGKSCEAHSYLHPCQPTTRLLIQPTVVKRLLCAQYYSRCLGFTSEQNRKCYAGFGLQNGPELGQGDWDSVPMLVSC